MSTFNDLASDDAASNQERLNNNAVDSPELVGPVAGGLIIAMAISGLLDDSGLLTHPWWMVVLAAIAAVGLLMGAKTIRELLASL